MAVTKLLIYTTFFIFVKVDSNFSYTMFEIYVTYVMNNLSVTSMTLMLYISNLMKC